MDFARVISAFLFITFQSTPVALIISCPFILIMPFLLDGSDTKRVLEDTSRMSLAPFASLFLITLLGAWCCRDGSMHWQTRGVAMNILGWLFKIGLASSIANIMFFKKRIGYRIALVITQVIWLTLFDMVCGMAVTDTWL